MQMYHHPTIAPLVRLLGCGTFIAAVTLTATPALAAGCGGSVQTGHGDGALALAQRCGTTVQDLRIANPGIDLNKPLNGKIVRIPPSRPQKYIPDSIARGAPPASSVLSPLPHSHTPIIPQARRDTDREIRTGYVVRAGDTLSAIAERAAVPLNRLLVANPGIEPRRLAVGQTIAIPETD